MTTISTFDGDLQYAQRCVILGAGPEPCGAELVQPSDLVIVCDGGLRYAQQTGLRFDVLLGDFDSVGDAEIPAAPTVLTLPREKDDTDLLYAVKYALARGRRNFLLLGATGGRSDHFLGNLSAGVRIAQNGGICVLIGPRERIYIYTRGTLCLRAVPDTYVSLLPLGDAVRGVTSTGLYYPLQDATLTHDFPLGVSNEFDAATPVARITVREGVCAVIVSSR